MISTIFIVICVIALALLAIPLATGLLLALCGLVAVACHVLPILFIAGVIAGFYGLTGRKEWAYDLLTDAWDEVLGRNAEGYGD